MDKYQNKYRIPSARLQHWNYGAMGSYFITICTQHRYHYFGDVVNGEMQLSEIGQLVQTEWIKTFTMRPDMNLEMGNFVVMPNHFHAVIIIGDNDCKDAMHGVSATTTKKNHIPKKTDIPDTTERANQFGPQSKNLASIVRGFKSAVTVQARLIHADFGWQPRFHDHIIRNTKSFEKIQQYITNNPLNWQEDKFSK